MSQGRRKHFSFGQAKHSGGVTPLCWTGKWIGMQYGMDYGVYSNTQLDCVAICLLTYSQPALPCISLHSCSLFKVVGVKGHMQFNKLHGHIHSYVGNSLTCNKRFFYTKTLQSVSCVSVQQFETLSGKLLIIHVKRGKFLEFKTSEIASASLSGTIEQTMVRWSPGLPDLLHRPCDIYVDTAELLQPCQHSLHQPLKCGRGITLLACPMGITLNSQSPLCVINTVSSLDSGSIGICQQSLYASKVETFFLLS